jgi:hypothetical protein
MYYRRLVQTVPDAAAPVSAPPEAHVSGAVARSSPLSHLHQWQSMLMICMQYTAEHCHCS